MYSMKYTINGSSQCAKKGTLTFQMPTKGHDDAKNSPTVSGFAAGSPGVFDVACGYRERCRVRPRASVGSYAGQKVFLVPDLGT